MRSKGLGSEGSAVLSLELSEVIRKDKSFLHAVLWALQTPHLRLVAVGQRGCGGAAVITGGGTGASIFDTRRRWIRGNTASKACQKSASAHQAYLNINTYIYIYSI